jgi:hypothetical protein
VNFTNLSLDTSRGRDFISSWKWAWMVALWVSNIQITTNLRNTVTLVELNLRMNILPVSLMKLKRLMTLRHLQTMMAYLLKESNWAEEKRKR